MNKKFLIGGLVGVVVIAVAYFGAGGAGLQGKLQGSQPVTRGEMAMLIWDTINSFKTIEVKNPASWGCYYDIKGGEPYALAVCNLPFIIQPDSTSGNWSPNDYISRGLAMRYFVEAYHFAITGYSSVIAHPVKDEKIYKDVYGSSYEWGLKYWYDDFATLELGDVKGWKGLNFFPDANLTQGRAQVWADNLKKALNK